MAMLGVGRGRNGCSGTSPVPTPVPGDGGLVERGRIVVRVLPCIGPAT